MWLAAVRRSLFILLQDLLLLLEFINGSPLVFLLLLLLALLLLLILLLQLLLSQMLFLSALLFLSLFLLFKEE